MSLRSLRWLGQGRVGRDSRYFPPSFNQNPKQVLVASSFWCDWAGVTHYQYQPLSYEHSWYGTSVLGVRADAGTKYPCFFFFPITRSIRVFFLLPLLLLLYQGRSSSQYGCHWGRIWKDLGAELKKISGCLFVLFFIAFVTRFLYRLV